MLNRVANISLQRSFFLFGARGTGKSTLLSRLLKDKRTSVVDLLDPNFFRLSPKSFQAHLDALAEGTEWVVLDEIQRSPELLNLSLIHI